MHIGENMIIYYTEYKDGEKTLWNKNEYILYDFKPGKTIEQDMVQTISLLRNNTLTISSGEVALKFFKQLLSDYEPFIVKI